MTHTSGTTVLLLLLPEYIQHSSNGILFGKHLFSLLLFYSKLIDTHMVFSIAITHLINSNALTNEQINLTESIVPPAFALIGETINILFFSDGSVKCFCDKRNCEDSLICSGKWCLVGFKNEGQWLYASIEMLPSMMIEKKTIYSW